jgi:hypothetical protein
VELRLICRASRRCLPTLGSHGRTGTTIAQPQPNPQAKGEAEGLKARLEVKGDERALQAAQEELANARAEIRDLTEAVGACCCALSCLAVPCLALPCLALPSVCGCGCGCVRACVSVSCIEIISSI